MFHKPNIFISACIEFESCRFDGTSISDDTVKRLKKHVNILKACPEMAIGFSSPRESLRLIERKNDKRRFVISSTGEDFSDEMNAFSTKYISKLKQKQLDGFILKAKSPSCGVYNVKVYHDIGKAHTKSSKESGVFGGLVKEVFGNVPVETERRLSNFKIRETFYTYIFSLAHFRFVKESMKMKDLVKFHSEYKYLFMTYNQSLLKKLGNIVANHDHLKREEMFRNYEVILRQLLKKEATEKRRINVLTHIYGYFKTKLTVSEKEFYFELLDQYLNHQIPYRSILNLLYSWVLRFDESYLIEQRIFNPYPQDLLVVADSGKRL